MENYLYNLEDIPIDHRPLFESINKAIKKAFVTKSSLTRDACGGYYVVIDNELIGIHHEAIGWMAKEESPFSKWYSDPYPTLKELKERLGI